MSIEIVTFKPVEDLCHLLTFAKRNNIHVGTGDDFRLLSPNIDITEFSYY